MINAEIFLPDIEQDRGTVVSGDAIVERPAWSTCLECIYLRHLVIVADIDISLDFSYVTRRRIPGLLPAR